MKPIRKRKKIEVKYKGYKAIQTPWNGYEGKYYALHIINPEGKCELHSGMRSKCSTRKELKLQLIRYLKVTKQLLWNVFNSIDEGEE